MVESIGPFNSDIHPMDGVQQAKCIAERIASSSGSDIPTVVYTDPFERTTHTGHVLATKIGVSVKIEEGLWEWLVPSLLVTPDGTHTEPKSVQKLSQRFGTVDTSHTHINPYKERHHGTMDTDAASLPEGAPRFPETEEALLKRCATTLSGILKISNGESIAIVSHAPCNQAMAFFLEGAASPEQSKLGPWPLGGITMFARTIRENGAFGDWTMELTGDTQHMPGDYKAGIKEWSLPSFG